MRLRVALAYAFRCSPAELRDLTLVEVAAMCEFLEELAEGVPDPDGG